jgi:glycosyltransferase involved in cell wall biosynthesis
MWLVFAISLFTSIIYLLVILSFSIGWEKIKNCRKGLNSPSSVFISVVIPFRNEEKNIPSLLKSLQNQTLNPNFFEILLIDDNSTDNSQQILIQNIEENSNIIPLKVTQGQGKKNAIKFGIENSKGNLIVTTDADCTHHKKWLETIYLFYNDHKNSLIIGPVLMKGTSFIENIQSLDFFSLVASGAGACGINKPIMCNGANLAFDKELFRNFADPLNQKFKSGDDVFLMHHIKEKYPGKIHFLKSENAMVFTKAENNIRNFLKQRIRWASKSKGYTDKDTIFTAFVVLLINLTLFINLILSFLKPVYFNLFTFQLITKSLIDLFLLIKVANFYNQKKLLLYFIPTQLINIVIVPIIALLGFLIHIEWKK